MPNYWPGSSSGGGGTVTAVTGTLPITSTGGNTPDIAVNDFTGDAGAGGLNGAVPAPAVGDATKFLKGDGTWSTPAGGGGSCVLAGFFSNTAFVPISTQQYTGMIRPSAAYLAVPGFGNQMPMSAAKTLGNLSIVCQFPQAADDTFVVTVQKNGVDTAVSVIVPAAGVAGVYADLVNTVAFAVGDLFGLHLTNNSAISQASLAAFSFTLT